MRMTKGVGIQVKEGSSDIFIKNCRFEHSEVRAMQIGGSTGKQVLPLNTFYRQNDGLFAYFEKQMIVSFFVETECSREISWSSLLTNGLREE